MQSYEKSRLPIFNMKAINRGPNLFFQSLLLFITDYYSVQFPCLLTLQFLGPLQCLLTFSQLLSVQKCNITSRVNIGHVPTPFLPSIPNLRVSQIYWPDEDTITNKSQIKDYLFRTRP